VPVPPAKRATRAVIFLALIMTIATVTVVIDADAMVAAGTLPNLAASRNSAGRRVLSVHGERGVRF